MTCIYVCSNFDEEMQGNASSTHATDTLPTWHTGKRKHILTTSLLVDWVKATGAFEDISTVHFDTKESGKNVVHPFGDEYWEMVLLTAVSRD